MDAKTLPGFGRNFKTAIAGGVLTIGFAVAAFALAAGEVAAKPGCGGHKATIVRGVGNDVINVPKHGPQVIVAGGRGGAMTFAGTRVAIAAWGAARNRVVSAARWCRPR